MKNWQYVMLIERGKTYNKINKEMVIKHVDFMRKLDDDGKLEFCGAFKGFPGMGGMIILKTESYEEADALCKTEPFVEQGYATYKLYAIQPGNRENNYLL
ncbi:MAG: YciI family protein [Eggerthellaceae bacterium]|nr:YciI family protein [Eggerthellaceae bacterium]